LPLRALVFDVDGVLVQSMEAHHEAYRRAFADYRVDIKKDDVFQNEGRRSKEVIETLAKAKSLRLTPEQFEEMNKKKQQIFYSFGPLPLYPGVPELLAKAKSESLKLAAVTGTNRPNVEQHLGSLVKRFDVIVTQEDVRHTKPDPEPYLAALQKLALKANECIVVENAPLGIRSAKAAGLRVVAITSTMPREALAMADVIVPSIKDVWSAVEKLK
jgi:beta-phosphoglucomutase